MKPSENLVREFRLKSRLSSFCNRQLKVYARKKADDNKNNEKFKILAEAFIASKAMSYKYSIFLTILFAREYEDIKSRVIANQIDFERISYEAYWEGNGKNLRLVDAIFFSYTFYSEAFPVGEAVIEEIAEVISTSSDINIVDEINRIIAKQ